MIPTTRGEQTRQAILNAAKELFIRQGYAATTMRQIARDAGVTVAAIYNHFAGKDVVFDALLRQAVPLDDLSRLLDAAHGDPAEVVLRSLFRGVMALMEAHQDYLALALIDAQERDGATLVTFVPIMFQRLVALHAKLAAGPERGGLRDIPPHVFSRALVSLVMGYVLTERVAKPQATLNLPDTDWAEALADVFMRGVLADKDGQGTRVAKQPGQRPFSGTR